MNILQYLNSWPIIFGASDNKLGGGLDARLLGHVPHQFGRNRLPIDTTQYSFNDAVVLMVPPSILPMLPRFFLTANGQVVAFG